MSCELARPIADPVAGPIAGPVARPIAGPVARPIAGRVAWSIAGRVAWSIAGRVAWPIAGPVACTVAGPVARPIAGPAARPIAGRAARPIAGRVAWPIAGRVAWPIAGPIAPPMHRGTLTQRRGDGGLEVPTKAEGRSQKAECRGASRTPDASQRPEVKAQKAKPVQLRRPRDAGLLATSGSIGARARTESFESTERIHGPIV